MTISLPILQRKRGMRRTLGERYLLYDTFSGSGSLASHTPDIVMPGAAWAIIAGSNFTLSGGFLTHTYDVNYNRAIINCGTPDIEILTYMKCSQYEGRIIYRAESDGSTYYALDIDETKIDAIVGGSATPITLMDGVTQALTRNQWYTIGIKAFLNQLRVYRDGVYYGYATIPTYLTQTYVGLGHEQPAGNASWDNFIVKPVYPDLVAKFTVIGDSISNDDFWVYKSASTYHNGFGYVSANHAAGGSTISAHMAIQVTAAAADDADYIFILLGTNDSVAYNPEAVYATQLQALGASNTRAKIYAMGYLNTTSKTVEQRMAFNAHIEAAVTTAIAAGVTVEYWNTDDWINPATDTSDGLHPNAAGNVKIAAQVMSRLP